MWPSNNDSNDFPVHREDVREDVESSEDEDMEVDENTSDMSGDEQKTKKHNLTSENPVSEAHKRIKKLKRSDILDFKKLVV